MSCPIISGLSNDSAVKPGSEDGDGEDEEIVVVTIPRIRMTPSPSRSVSSQINTSSPLNKNQTDDVQQPQSNDPEQQLQSSSQNHPITSSELNQPPTERSTTAPKMVSVDVTTLQQPSSSSSISENKTPTGSSAMKSSTQQPASESRQVSASIQSHPSTTSPQVSAPKMSANEMEMALKALMMGKSKTNTSISSSPSSHSSTNNVSQHDRIRLQQQYNQQQEQKLAIFKQQQQQQQLRQKMAVVSNNRIPIAPHHQNMINLSVNMEESNQKDVDSALTTTQSLRLTERSELLNTHKQEVMQLAVRQGVEDDKFNQAYKQTLASAATMRKSGENNNVDFTKAMETYVAAWKHQSDHLLRSSREKNNVSIQCHNQLHKMMVRLCDPVVKGQIDDCMNKIRSKLELKQELRKKLIYQEYKHRIHFLRNENIKSGKKMDTMKLDPTIPEHDGDYTETFFKNLGLEKVEWTKQSLAIDKEMETLNEQAKVLYAQDYQADEMRKIFESRGLIAQKSVYQQMELMMRLVSKRIFEQLADIAVYRQRNNNQETKTNHQAWLDQLSQTSLVSGLSKSMDCALFEPSISTITSTTTSTPPNDNTNNSIASTTPKSVLPPSTCSFLPPSTFQPGLSVKTCIEATEADQRIYKVLGMDTLVGLKLSNNYNLKIANKRKREEMEEEQKDDKEGDDYVALMDTTSKMMVLPQDIDFLIRDHPAFRDLEIGHVRCDELIGNPMEINNHNLDDPIGPIVKKNRHSLSFFNNGHIRLE